MKIALGLVVVVIVACAPQIQGAGGGDDPAGDDSDSGSGDDDAAGYVVEGDDGDASEPPPYGDDTLDASPPDTAPTPPFDAGPDGLCATAVGAGDLVIDELMISSVSGSGDYGEWLEVRSTRPCALDVIGLHGECPAGSKVHTFDVTTDLWLEPSGTFVVADTADPVVDHALPSPLVVWNGAPGDVLKNSGATVTLVMNGALVDSVTYPNLHLTVGASVAFPSDCPPADRSVWTSWQTSTASWFPGFFGTPNAPNDDVRCP